MGQLSNVNQKEKLAHSLEQKLSKKKAKRQHPVLAKLITWPKERAK